MKLRDYVNVILPPALILAGVTAIAWMLRETLTLANFTMIYILVVLVLAVWRGTWVALVASFVSFLCINYFLVHPYYTFLVADPREVLDLIVYFIAAALAGQLASRERQQATAAHQRAHEQEILYRLTRAFNQLTTNEGVYNALVSTVKNDLGAQEAYVLPYQVNTHSHDVTVHYLLLQAGHKVYGTLCVSFVVKHGEEHMRLLNTCTSQAAMALHRIDLAERASKSQQFEEADRLKTALLHAVSHDLRTPVTIIKTSAHNMKKLDEQFSPTERYELSESIEQEADRLDKLVGNLLDMSRLRAGAMTLNTQPNSLEEVAGDAAAYAYQRTKQERIRLCFPEDFPLAPFDYGLILQAVTNLVDNALRYEPPDSQIELLGSVRDSEVRLHVINHGENILEEERQHLMEPFYHSKHGKTGLGLPIAKGIVEAHHGRLWVEDTPGGGATFVIGLPIKKDFQHDA